MKIYPQLRKLLYLDSYGWIAVAALLICSVSGALLIAAYDINEPYLSISRLISDNPSASLIRNIHYWSAHIFLIFTLIHIYDHLKQKNETNIRNHGIWLRLILSILFTFYVMLSGFILKGDGDSFQAHRIFSALLNSLPFAGSILQQTFVGNESDFQVLYIQHAATATIFLFIVLFEHARSLRVNNRTFLITLFFVLLLSFTFRAPLHSPDDEMMKGPWYFVGLQEVLHWIENPLVVMAFVFMPVVGLYLLRFTRNKVSQTIKIFFVLMALLYIILSINGLFFRAAYWQWQWPWDNAYKLAPLLDQEFISWEATISGNLPVIQGRVEACLTCHAGMQGFSDGHKPENIGCFACHGGDPWTRDKFEAHKDMVKVPGNLSNSKESCGSVNCHPAIVERVSSSMMATLSGMISVDKWVFGEIPLPDGHEKITEIGQSPAEVHLRNLCAGCHLGNEKTKVGKADWLDRGGGCLACHLNYNDNAISSLQKMQQQSVSDTTTPKYHPDIDLKITNDRCLSCHSRSGRIATNFEGWHETNLKPEAVIGKPEYRLLPDQRVFTKMQADVHHEKGMTCIDCHGSYELMGDGNHYNHKEEAVKVQCSDCHTRQSNMTRSFAEVDKETQLIAWSRKYKTEDVNLIVTQKAGFPLVNTLVDEEGKRLRLIKKSGGDTVLMKPPASICTEGKAHQNLSCESCHSAWVPQCIGCHNTYENKTKGFDLLMNNELTGTWVEYADAGLAGLPVLGMKIAVDSTLTVATFAPGMIMQIENNFPTSEKETTFHRIYAPVSAHTTIKQGRDCKSCHNNSLAIGYGRGQLIFSKTGIWSFGAEYQNNKYDNLPEDAWIGFLQERSDQAATRLNMRPFNIVEQKRILTVGACLSCHDEKSKVMQQSLGDFGSVFEKRNSKCVVPVW
ncbi:MAG: hypothetical protein HOO86_13365 [Bacteroidales bacterium]|nr:hypothetical protein [Bacteroidales bacterium]